MCHINKAPCNLGASPADGENQQVSTHVAQGQAAQGPAGWMWSCHRPVAKLSRKLPWASGMFYQNVFVEHGQLGTRAPEFKPELGPLFNSSEPPGPHPQDGTAGELAFQSGWGGQFSYHTSSSENHIWHIVSAHKYSLFLLLLI